MDRLNIDEAGAEARMRARDFWSALVLAAVALFFLWQSQDIPLAGHRGAGVTSAGWYTSAAVVPLGIFGALLVLALVLLAISIQSGAARQALSATGLGWQSQEAARIGALSLILLAYIVGLVPRVDFILSSALLITALICGFHGQARARPLLPLLAVAVPGAYALLRFPAQADWSRHGDDWITLACLLALTCWHQARSGRSPSVRLTPVLALALPVLLICAMAFGFRQNVPNRGSLIFSQIEFAYYVHLRPLWRP